MKEYSNPLNAILLFKFRERLSGRKSVVLRDKIRQLGFKYIQSGVYVLPPILTPPNLNSGEDVRKWVHKIIIDYLGTNFEYVIPFAILIDLRKAYSERKVPEKAWGRTIFGVLGPDELFPPEYIIRYIKHKRHISLEDIIRLGDITFLAAKSLSDSELLKLQENKDEIISKIKSTFSIPKLNLSEYAKMDSIKLVPILRSYVSNPTEVAKTIVDEASFWNNFLKEKIII